MWHCWYCVLTVHQRHTGDNTEICFLLPLTYAHTPPSSLSLPYGVLLTFVGWESEGGQHYLIYLWGAVQLLALSPSLRPAPYSIFLLTAFVHFINITFWYSDRYAPPEDTCSFLLYQKYSLYFHLHLWQEDSDCFYSGRFHIFNWSFKKKCIFWELQLNTVCISCTFRHLLYWNMYKNTWKYSI